MQVSTLHAEIPLQDWIIKNLNHILFNYIFVFYIYLNRNYTICETKHIDFGYTNNRNLSIIYWRSTLARLNRVIWRYLCYFLILNRLNARSPRFVGLILFSQLFLIHFLNLRIILSWEMSKQNSLVRSMKFWDFSLTIRKLAKMNEITIRIFKSGKNLIFVGASKAFTVYLLRHSVQNGLGPA